MMELMVGFMGLGLLVLIPLVGILCVFLPLIFMLWVMYFVADEGTKGTIKLVIKYVLLIGFLIFVVAPITVYLWINAWPMLLGIAFIIGVVQFIRKDYMSRWGLSQGEQSLVVLLLMGMIAIFIALVGYALN